MTRRKFIVLGDTTSHGGKVTSARGANRMTFNGKPVACVGDIVYCPKCKGTHRIIEGAIKPPMWLDDVLIAVEGCLTSCGAVLISVGQNIGWHEGGIGLDAVTVETLRAETEAAEAAELVAPSRSTSLALPDSDFCLECWLKALAQRSVVMGL
jgi:uncharacterized Zn-binding protein involved in type VI secretion